MKSYSDQKTWQLMQQYLLEHNRITEEFYPTEEFWSWKNNKIYLDTYRKADSKAKVILLHGVGGNGRLLSFIGIPLYKNGLEVIAPDLPGYGYSQIDEEVIDYSLWIDLVDDLINEELEKDHQPIFLLGLSAGGMLAYHVACINKKVDGLIVTNLLDQRIQVVRDASATNIVMSRLGVHLINFLNKVRGKIQLPMKLVAQMKSIVNDQGVLELLLKDRTSSGSYVSIRFIHSLMNTPPKIEPEAFNRCPVLLAHPEKDRWTGLNLSKLFFDRLNTKKELKLLKNAGHFPIEEPGINQLEEYTIDFIDSLTDKSKI
jgi:alpha-beta hydrolase superfamily lysophospholipase